jgi:FkbM family methyltransferase
MFYYRDQDITGIKPDLKGWLWPEGDDGLWEGPRTDWENSHQHKIKQFVEHWDVVIQAGGGAGVYPRLLSEMFGTVYTFEPDMLNFHCLVNNCCKENIYKFQAALGETPAMVGISNTSTSNRGTHNIMKEGDNKSIVQIRIDDLNLEHCNFIMLDIEGYEKYALDGARRTINKFRPVIMAEGGTRIEDQLTELGYKRVEQSVSDTIFVPG